ncbi:MAG TPA: protealysin inhibitor emfourin [Nitrososphaeraceae archaeon]
MRIRVERSGGLAGIPISNEIDEKDLPSTLIRTAKKMIEDKKSPSLSMKSSPRGAADHYSYKISILDGTIKRVIECNQFELQDDLRSLIKYVEKHPNKRTK